MSVLGNDCGKCKSYYGYYDWFPMTALNPLCRVQCIFLIEHLDLLEDGKYPVNPKETGYTGIDPAIRTVARSTPRWMVVAELYAEITGRIAMTGEDGKDLIEEVQRYHENLPPTVGDYRIEPWQLNGNSQTALNYITGYSTPLIPYATWKQKREYSAEEVVYNVRFGKEDDELWNRLVMTGEAREVLYHEVKSGLSTFGQLSPLACLAVEYSVRHRKQLFSQWKAGKKYLLKNNKTIVLPKV